MCALNSIQLGGSDDSRHFQTLCVMVALFLLAGVSSARAQENSHRGFEAGMDIYGRSVHGGSRAISAGSMATAWRDSGTPRYGSSRWRAFRPAASFRVPPTRTRSNVRHLPCMDRGSGMVSAGVRIPIVRGQHAGTSLKSLGFSERLFGSGQVADVSTEDSCPASSPTSDRVLIVAGRER